MSWEAKAQAEATEELGVRSTRAARPIAVEHNQFHVPPKENYKKTATNHSYKGGGKRGGKEEPQRVPAS